MPIRFGIRLPPCEPPQTVAAAARAAEAAGFDDVWTLDSPLLAGRLGDPYVTLAACAGTTSSVIPSNVMRASERFPASMM